MNLVTLYANGYGVCKTIGFVLVISKLLGVSYLLLKKLYFHIYDVLNPNSCWKNTGRWAIITGGTDGIGKAYAEELADRGFDICLISRNIEKLHAVGKEIERNYKVLTVSINVDFTEGSEIYEKIGNCIENLEGGIGVLVNNVGMSYNHAEYYHLVENGEKVMMDLINSNVASCTMMMKLLLPRMQDNGIIINISSLLALYPIPLLTTYAACKAFVDSISRSVQYECKGKGITIQSVLPGYVATKMSNRRRSKEIPTAKDFVSSAIKTVGKENVTYGYFAHKIRGLVHEWLKRNMPACVNFAIAMHFMKNAREGYYRKIKKN